MTSQLAEWIHGSDASTGITIVVVGGLLAYFAKKLTDWTRKSRKRDLTDALREAIAQAPDVLQLVQGQAQFRQQLDELRVEVRVMRSENTDQHATMRRRMDRIAEAHADTRARLTVAEAGILAVQQDLHEVGEKEQR